MNKKLSSISASVAYKINCDEFAKAKAGCAAKYWGAFEKFSKDLQSKALIWDVVSKDNISENEKRFIADFRHSNLVARIKIVDMARNATDWEESEFESFDDFVKKNSIDLDHFERYKKKPIYTEIVENIKAYKAELAAEV